MHRLYLSRTNLQTLLDKLDSGYEQSAIMKNDPTHPTHPTKVPTMVVALEDSVYYHHITHPHREQSSDSPDT